MPIFDYLNDGLIFSGIEWDMIYNQEQDTTQIICYYSIFTIGNINRDLPLYKRIIAFRFADAIKNAIDIEWT